MVARAYPSANTPPECRGAGHDCGTWPPRQRARGEVASHTRKLEALERRGRALRAEIGRKVEELAQEDRASLRDAAAYAEEEDAGAARAQRAAADCREKVHGRAADRAGKGTRRSYEQACAARRWSRPSAWMQTREAKRTRAKPPRATLRRQIEELRGSSLAMRKRSTRIGFGS
jgi:serine/threonine-protein kinase